MDKEISGFLIPVLGAETNERCSSLARCTPSSTPHPTSPALRSGSATFSHRGRRRGAISAFQLISVVIGRGNEAVPPSPRCGRRCLSAAKADEGCSSLAALRSGSTTSPTRRCPAGQRGVRRSAAVAILPSLAALSGRQGPVPIRLRKRHARPSAAATSAASGMDGCAPGFRHASEPAAAARFNASSSSAPEARAAPR